MADKRTALLCFASTTTGIAIGFALSRIMRSRFQAVSGTSEDQKQGKLPESALLMEAARFSSEKHKDQRRKNSKQHPYICHPIRVARSLALDADVQDVDVLIAALLHDTVEDTDTTLEEIEKLFGPKVARIVDEVSDDKSLPQERRKQLQVEHAPHASPEAKLVKLADKLDNLTDLLTETPVGWQPDRVSQYFEWAEKVISGLRGTNEQLETRLDRVLANKGTAVQTAEANRA